MSMAPFEFGSFMLGLFAGIVFTVLAIVAICRV